MTHVDVELACGAGAVDAHVWRVSSCLCVLQTKAMGVLHDLETAAMQANPEAGHPEHRRALDTIDYPPPGAASHAGGVMMLH